MRMLERNAGVPPDRRIEFRIGIHIGDIVEESDGDLMGDGVNIAARLEGIAEPNGICLSGAAYEQVRDKLKEEFEDLGDKELKNIARPVRAYRVALSRDTAERADCSRAVRWKTSAARQAVDRRLAVPEHERRPGTGILRRRYRRGHHHRLVEASRLLRHRAQFDFRVQGQGARYSSGRARARCSLRTRRQRPQGG